mmetsp:Transcript_108193/g.314629  ORF Transcript_108193/g.314629 Transcript_108193/m.314629 type:complete len:281 (+) Transcript_108193:479-1321(+)
MMVDWVVVGPRACFGPASLVLGPWPLALPVVRSSRDRDSRGLGRSGNLVQRHGDLHELGEERRAHARHGVPALLGREAAVAAAATAGVSALGDVSERVGVAIDELVERAEARLAVGHSRIVEQGDHASHGRSGRAGAADLGGGAAYVGPVAHAARGQVREAGTTVVVVLGGHSVLLLVRGDEVRLVVLDAVKVGEAAAREGGAVERVELLGGAHGRHEGRGRRPPGHKGAVRAHALVTGHAIVTRAKEHGGAAHTQLLELDVAAGLEVAVNDVLLVRVRD